MRPLQQRFPLVFACVFMGLGPSGCSDEDAVVYATQLSSYDGNTCARMSDGTARCWGSLTLLDALFGGRMRPPTEAVVVPALRDVAEISVGGMNVCGRLQDATVQCWTAGSFGLGLPRSAPPLVAGVSGVAQVSAGYGHVCARLASGSVRCWGANRNGQRGERTSRDTDPPTLVPSLSGVTQIASGQYGSCVRMTDGSVQCWGSIVDASSDPFPPTMIQDVMNVAQIAYGANHVCARTTGGEVYCWGDNDHGQIGFTPNLYPSPLRVIANLRGVIEIAAGGTHTCARMTDSTVRCWGSNLAGELGSGPLRQDQSVPTQVPSLTGVVELSLGRAYSCARMADHSVQCWGSIAKGATPTRVTGL